MGASRWSTEDYTDYVSTTNLRSLSRHEVFSSVHLQDALDPTKMRVGAGINKDMAIRESMDSAENPRSTPIIIGLDVTGSMGFVAEEIAKHGLAKIMGDIYEKKPVSDPHLLFAGIGDVACDEAPLQVSQFETDVRIVQQLRELYLEGGGGGNDTESYDLVWYFAAFKTEIDCIKRGEKGYLFTIGDEMPPRFNLDKASLEYVFGKLGDSPTDIGPARLLSAAQEKYKVFHIIAEQGSYARSHLQKVRAAWKELMGPNVIFMKDVKDFPDIMLATLRIANGEDMNQVVAEAAKPEVLAYAFEMDGY